MAYDDTNVFAKILRGELPSHKIYEDAETFAFMDIMPRGDGHCLVIPKTPSRNILDADPQYKFGDVALAYGLALIDKQDLAAARTHLEQHVRRWRHPVVAWSRPAGTAGSCSRRWSSRRPWRTSST